MKNHLRLSVSELLVLICIIAVLGAALFPGYVRAVEKSNRESCAENLATLARAMLTYAQDWDNRLPPYCDGWHGQWAVPGVRNNQPFPGHCWWHLVHSYVPDLNQVRFCPSIVTLEAPRGLEAASQRHSSYGFNCEPVYQLEIEGTDRDISCEDLALGRSDRFGTAELGVPFSLSLTQIPHPEEWVMLSDAGDLGWVEGARGPGTVRLPGHCTCTDQCGPNAGYRSGLRTASGGVSRYRHGGGPNIAFGDGHVKWFPYQEIISNTSAWRL
jgi:prepilin-type processing-associated H-X9-DG protein